MSPSRQCNIKYSYTRNEAIYTQSVADIYDRTHIRIFGITLM